MGPVGSLTLGLLLCRYLRSVSSTRAARRASTLRHAWTAKCPFSRLPTANRSNAAPQVLSFGVGRSAPTTFTFSSATTQPTNEQELQQGFVGGQPRFLQLPGIASSRVSSSLRLVDAASRVLPVEVVERAIFGSADSSFVRLSPASDVVDWSADGVVVRDTCGAFGSPRRCSGCDGCRSIRLTWVGVCAIGAD